jgi:uncharacterized protein YecE (DUF72 family)
MRVLTGTSGFSFDEWQARFYPKGLAADDRLAYYASRLHSVEINNTFYQMPKPALLERWRRAVPDGFRFALKAPRRFTHSQRLRTEGDWLERFLTAAAMLGPKLGPVLFQLPPFLHKDAPLLAEFLAKLPATLHSVIEFRHPSWFDDEIFALLANQNVALCGGDSDTRTYTPPFVATATFGYFRLRAASYDANSLRDWSKRIVAERWTDAYVYLKHEVLGPDYALFLAAVASGAPEPQLPPEVRFEDTAQITQARPRKGLAQAKLRARDKETPAVTAPKPVRRKRAG